MKTHNILGVDFNLLSYEDVLEKILFWKKNTECHYVTLTPPYSVLMCLRDSKLKRATKNASLTLPDGVGIILAAKLFGYPHNGRVSGPTLMLKVCGWGRKYDLRHFFYGGASGVAEALADRMTALFPGLNVTGFYCPPFRRLTSSEDKQIVRRINASKPDIIWVGLGSPKQEKWMAKHIGMINSTALIGVGAAFDFHSGQAKWAPAWMRKIGIEWAYRLAQEPGRMWRRNVNSFVFLAKVLNQRLRASNGRQLET
jgi:N-acetylglucosaminyldiphosphoundecaprenol N-acetyl-beta-D-mannosaminyltransferase